MEQENQANEKEDSVTTSSSQESTQGEVAVQSNKQSEEVIPPQTPPQQQPEEKQVEIKQTNVEEKAPPKETPVEKKESPRQTEKMEKPSQPAQQPAQQPPQQQGGGWGSWGGLWSVASSVVQSVDQYVKPTLNSVTETTSQMVRELIVDEPTMPARFPRPEEDKKEQEEAAKKTEEKEEQDDSFFATVDKGVLSAVDYLGAFLNEGIKAASSVNTDDLSTKAKDFQTKAFGLASSSLQKAKEVTSTATESTIKLGERLAAQSVDTLEAVGKSALDLLTVEEEVGGNKRRIRPVFLSAQTAHMTKEEQENFEEVLNRSYFEESNGVAHLQTLENLSVQSVTKLQTLEQLLDAKQREELYSMLNIIKTLLESAEEEEDKDLQLPEVAMNEPAVKQSMNISAFEKSCHDQAKGFVETFKNELKSLKPADASAELILSPADLVHLTASFLDKILLESVQRVNQFSAASVEQLLRIVESILIDSDLGLTPQDALTRATYAFTADLVLNDRLSKISTSFIDCMQAVTELGKVDCLQFGKAKPDAAVESKKCAEDLDTKMSLHVNHIYLETSNAIANLEDCKKFLFSITKGVLVASLAPKESAPKGDASTEEGQSKEEETK